MVSTTPNLSLTFPPPAPGESGGAPASPPGPEDGGAGAGEGEEVEASGEGDKGADKVIWLKEEEETLLDVLEEARANGSGADNGFKATTYRDVEAALAKKAGVKRNKVKAKDVKSIENHWKVMKANWREVRGIVAQSGFGWNVEDDCVEAESAVWEAYIEKNPKSRKWRKKGLWYYMRVDDLCAEAVASGEFAMDPALATATAHESEIEEVSDAEKDVKGKKRAAPSSSTARSTKRRGGGSDQFERMIDILSVMAQQDDEDSSTASDQEPVAAATRLLLTLDAEPLNEDDVAALIAHLAEHPGTARAYTALAGSGQARADVFRLAYLRRILAKLLV